MTHNFQYIISYYPEMEAIYTFCISSPPHFGKEVGKFIQVLVGLRKPFSNTDTCSTMSLTPSPDIFECSFKGFGKSCNASLKRYIEDFLIDYLSKHPCLDDNKTHNLTLPPFFPTEQLQALFPNPNVEK